MYIDKWFILILPTYSRDFHLRRRVNIPNKENVGKINLRQIWLWTIIFGSIAWDTELQIDSSQESSQTSSSCDLFRWWPWCFVFLYNACAIDDCVTVFWCYWWGRNRLGYFDQCWSIEFWSSCSFEFGFTSSAASWIIVCWGGACVSSIVQFCRWAGCFVTNWANFDKAVIVDGISSNGKISTQESKLSFVIFKIGHRYVIAELRKCSSFGKVT